ncbi:hypothetical protein Ancab_013317 [Ancistrocladus abbreviatus]
MSSKSSPADSLVHLWDSTGAGPILLPKLPTKFFRNKPESPALESPASLWESTGAGPVLLPKLPSKFVKSPAEPKSRRPVFTIEPTEDGREEEDDQPGAKKFFEVCYGCKKEISETDDVYMYSHLRAFCTPECRDIQIAKDEKEEITSPDLTVSEEFLKLDFSRQNQRQKRLNVAAFK